MIATIRGVYERYGFDPIETPLLEYTETLGKFLPDTDRPNAGVFSLQDDDEQWMSLRYDLTAPLARYFAQNFDKLPKPFRTLSRRAGSSATRSPARAASASSCSSTPTRSAPPAPKRTPRCAMMMADVMEALGLGREVRRQGQQPQGAGRRACDAPGSRRTTQKLIVLRAIDKLDKFGIEGVDAPAWRRAARTRAATSPRARASSQAQIEPILGYIASGEPAAGVTRGSNAHVVATINNLAGLIGGSEGGLEGRRRACIDLRVSSPRRAISRSRHRIDPSVVRGLEYYTGPVFEIELTFPVTNEKGETVVFGAVGGGGRYDGLVSRFRSEPVPATGFSIGVSRLANALKLTGNLSSADVAGPVVVLVMDRDQTARYQSMVSELRNAGIRAEMYLGSSGMNAQMKYANRRNAPAVVIEGSQEREQGVVTIKDMVAGAEAAKAVHRQRRDEGRPPRARSTSRAPISSRELEQDPGRSQVTERQARR